MEIYIGYALAGIFFILFLVTLLKKGNNAHSEEVKVEIQTPAINNELIEDLQLQIEELNKTIQDKDAQLFINNESAEVISAKNIEIDLLKKNNNDFIVKLEQQQLAINSVHSQLESFKLLAEEREAIIQNLQSTDSNKSLILEKQIVDLQKINEDLSSSLNVANESLELLMVAKEDNDSTVKKNAELIEIISDFESKVSKLNDTVTDKDNELVALNENIKSLQASLEEVTLLNNSKTEIMVELPPKKVLIVDDSIVIRTKMTNYLKAKGYEILTANDGQEALDLLNKQNDIDLVITDLEMPNLNGYELIKAIATLENYSHIPVVAITGHDEVTLNVEDAKYFYGVSKKPWDENVFGSKLRTLIG